MKCLTCGRDFSEGITFLCPKCKKDKLMRCLKCKKLNVQFKCKCGFEGP